MPRKFSNSHLVIASHNQEKIREISLLLAPFGLKILTARDLGLPEPEETGKTYLDNALIKAKACMALTGLAALSDDSGIEVEAFNGQPGLDTAPYTKQLGGREKVFALWQKLPEIAKNPKAAFVCVQVLLWPDEHYEHFLGRVNGRLSFPPRGNYGHGYDPVFIPDGHTITAAEMTLDEKNSYSHRFLALQKLFMHS